jgi:hypothetical protein
MKTNKGHRSGARILEVAILIALPVLFHYLIPVMTVIQQQYSYLGLLVMLFGLALSIWAATLFRKAGTSFRLTMSITSHG